MDEHDRHRLLTLLAAAGSGCLGGPGETGGSPTDENTPDGTDSTTDGNNSTKKTPTKG